MWIFLLYKIFITKFDVMIVLVIENYVEFGVPYADLVIQYSEQIALGLSGAAIFALLKKN